MQKIAIDIGYGDVKVKTEDKVFKFSTSIEQQKIIRKGFDFENNDNSTYLFNGKKYSVSNSLEKAINTRSFYFLKTYAPLLVYHALKLAKLNLNEPIVLATGLSLLNWSNVKEFSSSIKTLNVNNEIVTFKKIYTRPQGRGVFDDLSEEHKQGNVYVVDIGFNTLDCLAYKNTNAIPDSSFANKNGANKIINDFRNLLLSDFNGIDISEQEAKNVFINKFISINGQKIDYTNPIADLKNEYCEYLINELLAQDELIARADRVVFSGGGAYFLDENKIKEIMPQAIFSKEPYEYANVRGYYNIIE